MTKNIPDNIYDVVIIGGGPAGLTAGLYATRARLKTCLIESYSIMSQATMTEIIENYPAIEKIGGFDIIYKMKEQAKSFGLQEASGNVTEIIPEGATDLYFTIKSDSGNYSAFSVIIASGASSKKLNIAGEKEFTGKGVSYCATCDGAFFKNKNIAVIGGGDTAVEEAIFLTRFGQKVTIIHRRDKLRATKIIQERAFNNEKISFIWDSIVDEIKGKEKVEEIILKNVKTGEKINVSCDGVFIFTGWEPNTGFARGLVDMDENGGILVNANMATSRKGIFAAGDCAKRPLHQVITACGDGAIAGNSVYKFIEDIKNIEI
ncbi:thioredoxin reductase [Candidatus Omnitrophus magneticus]|uniref:Thioredoxin reductase n=1 Tax=Candidatus Omnitrophus magneticus TaxID=1609969 RepID=A0A0F0CRX9_9BACT|nr:thioredoxin reductase [Candidatus Omnitrophus magneticus]